MHGYSGALFASGWCGEKPRLLWRTDALGHQDIHGVPVVTVRYKVFLGPDYEIVP